MNLNSALRILQLDYPFSLAELRHAYYKAALRHHPDRNPNDPDSTKRFQEIQTANEYLSEHIGDDEHKTTSADSSYESILRKFIYSATGKSSGDISSIIHNIITKCSTTISDKIFDAIDKKTSVKLYNYISTNADILNINPDIVEYVREIVRSKIENDTVFVINPSLEDLFNASVYKLVFKDETYYVPLWHEEIQYDVDDHSVIIRCVPDLPDHVSIDHHNDINVNISIPMDRILEKKVIPFSLGNNTYDIPTKDLRLRSLQSYTFKEVGIAKIQPYDIYCCKHKADIIVHIALKE